MKNNGITTKGLYNKDVIAALRRKRKNFPFNSIFTLYTLNPSFRNTLCIAILDLHQLRYRRVSSSRYGLSRWVTQRSTAPWRSSSNSSVIYQRVIELPVGRCFRNSPLLRLGVLLLSSAAVCKLCAPATVPHKRPG